MKMKLDVKEILGFGALLPPKGNLIEIGLVQDMSKKVSLSQEEKEKIGLVAKGPGQLSWKDEKFTKDIDFSDTEIDFLKQQITRLDKEKNITLDLIGLCRKIKEIEVNKNQGGK